MKVSVVIVSHNVGPLLARCLTSVERQESDFDLHVVVVDNASEDDSVGMVARDFPAVEILALAENLGFSTAVNRGAASSESDFLLLLNPDTELPEGALGEMIALMAAQPEATALGVRQVDEHGFFQLAVGPRPSLPAELGRKWVQRSLDRGSQRTARWLDRRLSSQREVAWVTGSCLLVRRSAFEAVGGFDEDFFLFFEDIDFCLRLGRGGGNVLYEPSITIVHHRGASAAKAPVASKRAYRRSQILFWHKHRPGWEGLILRLYLRLKGEVPPPVAEQEGRG